MTGKELNKWADDFMFTAEPSKASDGPKAFLLGAPNDPLGHIAACAKMYKGEVVRDLATVTDAERMEYLEQIQKTVLKMPLEAVELHFMVEGVHRGITHQMVRQRTAAYAQESTRFAVKEDMKEATALPPSLMNTLPKAELVQQLRDKYRAQGLEMAAVGYSDHEILEESKTHISKEQEQRLKWDAAVEVIGNTYMELINDGMPAEEARGLMPTNITTRLNYITNLRSFYDTMAVRCSDQAQFEWRQLIMAMAKAMIEYGEQAEYKAWIPFEEDHSWKNYPGYQEWIEMRETVERGKEILIVVSAAWQYRALAEAIRPIEFVLGKRAFGANFDRPSRIGERVDAFAACGVPSDRWTTGAPEFGIPPINPAEWLFDPNSARLDPTQEFDLYGNRVPKGTGVHWVDPRGRE